MRLEAHVDVARAKLRKSTVARSAAERLDGGRTFVIVEPLGSPRLFTVSSSAVLEGFASGLEHAKSLRGEAKLRSATARARERLVERCDSIIERTLPDVGLLAMHLDGSELHVHAVGPCRAYLHRRLRTERITLQDEEAGGLLASKLVEASVTLEPRDLVLAGTLTAFTSASVGRVASVLERDAESSPPVLAQLLTDPAEQSGSGAAVIVLRAR